MRYSRDDSEFDRAIGFMDATFALALTLLVTTLEVDSTEAVWGSLSSLDDEVGTQFVAFGISFAVIANFWLIHHRMVASFAAIDYPVIVTNLFLIAAIVLLPFATEAVGDPATEDLPLPTVVMAVIVAFASALSGLVYGLAWKRDLLGSKPSREEAFRNLFSGLVPAAVFLASIPIAYLASPLAARASWLSLIVLGRVLDPQRRTRGEDG